LTEHRRRKDAAFVVRWPMPIDVGKLAVGCTRVETHERLIGQLAVELMQPIAQEGHGAWRAAALGKPGQVPS